MNGNGLCGQLCRHQNALSTNDDMGRLLFVEGFDLYILTC